MTVKKKEMGLVLGITLILIYIVLMGILLSNILEKRNSFILMGIIFKYIAFVFALVYFYESKSFLFRLIIFVLPKWFPRIGHISVFISFMAFGFYFMLVGLNLLPIPS
ncbi:hypothetical protein [Candidatus Uabimicrobium sp. HlEnr_7]|uniref:hypothetical protein n=1 Tax=Candidatus Uabimicrobium helgolandensis TaxID=3095367 RepID=UPI0035566E95